MSHWLSAWISYFLFLCSYLTTFMQLLAARLLDLRLCNIMGSLMSLTWSFRCVDAGTGRRILRLLIWYDMIRKSPTPVSLNVPSLLMQWGWTLLVSGIPRWYHHKFRNKTVKSVTVCYILWVGTFSHLVQMFFLSSFGVCQASDLMETGTTVIIFTLVYYCGKNAPQC